jgi:hypothetical protein
MKEQEISNGELSPRMDGRADFELHFPFPFFLITSDCLCRLLHFSVSFEQMVGFLFMLLPIYYFDTKIPCRVCVVLCVSIDFMKNAYCILLNHQLLSKPLSSITHSLSHLTSHISQPYLQSPSPHPQCHLATPSRASPSIAHHSKKKNPATTRSSFQRDSSITRPRNAPQG